MKELLNEVKGELARYGYKKSGRSFWKVENGFYKLIDFQKGAYGDYFLSTWGSILWACRPSLPENWK